MRDWVLIPLMGMMIPIVAIIATSISGVFKARYKAQMEAQQSSLTDEDIEQLQNLADKADAMAERVAILEKLLDQEVPHWREEHV